MTFELRWVEPEVLTEFKFIELEPGMDYTAYFIGTTDNASSSALVSPTSTLSFTTVGSQSVTISVVTS